MGDTRYSRGWQDWIAAKADKRAKSFLTNATDDQLVELLACKESATAPLDRNIIATELHNRSTLRDLDAGPRRQELWETLIASSRAVGLAKGLAKQTREMVETNQETVRAARAARIHAVTQALMQEERPSDGKKRREGEGEGRSDDDA